MSACRRWITPPYSRTRITLTPPHQSPWRLSYPRTKMVSCKKCNERINMSSANMFKVFIVGTGTWFIKRPLSGGLLIALTKSSVLEIEATCRYYREIWISFCSVSFQHLSQQVTSRVWSAHSSMMRTGTIALLVTLSYAGTHKGREAMSSLTSDSSTSSGPIQRRDRCRQKLSPLMPENLSFRSLG